MNTTQNPPSLLDEVYRNKRLDRGFSASPEKAREMRAAGVLNTFVGVPVSERREVLDALNDSIDMPVPTSPEPKVPCNKKIIERCDPFQRKGKRGTISKAKKQRKKRAADRRARDLDRQMLRRVDIE
ncbi:hypothetical protein KIPB_012661 [Kipferlia bialata]|uniref:Uncharacterized protein n=1 Tax=Kipferlia bialata TaxID=797122 RepID=A0A391NR97_9EUKA|nr:hypothetical protein KIPB_012661 [Kipferlia bialata]|eukprot:g12661.t1